METLEKACKQREKNTSATVEIAPSSPAQDSNLARLESELAKGLGMRVTLAYAEHSRGALIIGFDTLEILDGVLERLGYRP